MPNVETFPNAPIVEAILSIEVNYLQDLVTPVEAFSRENCGLLPVREEITSGSVSERGPGGYRFSSADGLQVLQITRRSFSFHRLRPYSDWERFAGDAHRLWREYLGHFTPETVRGANLRYLNRIDIPASFANLRDYISLLATLPAGLETSLSGYLLRLSLADESIPAAAYVTQRIQPETTGGVLPLVFDIDVRSELDLGIRDDSLWRVLEQLRDYKNRLFFSSITDAARDLFR